MIVSTDRENNREKENTMLRPLTDEQINTMMDVATQAFADHGFVGANVNKIARSAGVSIGVLYKYYETKEGLFIACVKRCLEFLDEVFERTFSIAMKHQTKNSSVNDGSDTGNVVHQEFISKDELMALISNLIREEQIAAKNHPEYFGGFIPFIGPGDIIEYGINTNNKSLSRIGLEFGRLAIAGSILQVCIGGSIGKAAINHVDLAFNQQINSITPIECNEEFLFCTMISPYFVETIKERAGGTATPIINRGEWDNILVPVAPIREQSRIVKTIESILKCFNISLGITSQ